MISALPNEVHPNNDRLSRSVGFCCCDPPSANVPASDVTPNNEPKGGGRSQEKREEKVNSQWVPFHSAKEAIG
jgi:hypothetical protein